MKKSKERTAGLTIRMSPKTKFSLELLARKQKRTLTDVVEWALVQQFLKEGIAVNE